MPNLYVHMEHGSHHLISCRKTSEKEEGELAVHEIKSHNAINGYWFQCLKSTVE